MKEFVQKYQLTLLIIALWVIGGRFLSSTVAAAIGVVGFFILMTRKDHGAVLMALLCMLFFSDSRSSMFQFAAVAKIGCAVLSLLYILLQSKELPVKRNYIFYAFLPFIGYAFLLVPFAEDFFDSLQKTASYSIIFLAVPSLYLGAIKSNHRFSLDLVRFIMLALAAGLLIRLVDPSFVTLAGRYRGLLGNPNGLGIFLTITFPIVYIILKRQSTVDLKVQQRVLFYSFIAISLLLCQSRTAILAILLFLLFNSIQALRGGFGLILFVILIFSYEFFLSQLPAIIIALNLGEYFRLDTLLEGSGRVVAWEFAWERVQDVFFFGGGFDYTNDLFKANYEYLSRLGHQGNAHNSFLTLWLDTGLIGIILFSIGLIRTILYSFSRSTYTLPLIYCILFSTNFESWLAASLNPFTSLFLIALTIVQNPDLHDEIDPSPIDMSEDSNVAIVPSLNK